MALKKECMKRILNIITGLAVLVSAAVSCQKEDSVDNTIDPKVIGEWHLTGARAEGGSIYTNIDIYLCINADSSFELYQKSGSQEFRYDLHTGTCYTQNGVLTGVYSDGVPWGGKYVYTKITNGIILKTTNDIEVQRYISCQIPVEIKANANPRTKSADSALSPIL